MIKVNLTRIHNLIKLAQEEARNKRTQARRLFPENDVYSFSVLHSTTDADLDAFRENVARLKKRVLGLFEDARQQMRYLAYLRQQLDQGNSQSGMGAKLLELGSRQSACQNLYYLRDLMALSCSKGLSPAKNADYYKTSFTENERVYVLGVQLFEQSDLDALDAEIENAEKAMLALRDEMALINQKTVLEILSFEEFCAQEK